MPCELANRLLRDRGAFGESRHESVPSVIEAKSDSCLSPRCSERGSIAGRTHRSVESHVVNVGHALVACYGHAMKGKDDPELKHAQTLLD